MRIGSFGAARLWPRLRVPVYATPFTASLFAAKRLSEPGAPVFRQRRAARQPSAQAVRHRAYLRVTRSRDECADHPPPLGNVRIPATGLDPTPIIGPPTDEAKLRALGDEGYLAMIGDSTNAVRDGRSPSVRCRQDAA